MYSKSYIFVQNTRNKQEPHEIGDELNELTRSMLKLFFFKKKF